MGSDDLMYDPNAVGPDCVVFCRISSGPRATDPTFDPRVGDVVSMIDDDGERLAGRIVERDGDGVRVRVNLGLPVGMELAAALPVQV